MANGGPPNENTPLTAEQFRKEMQSLVQSIQDRQKDLTLSNNASGIFFIVLVSVRKHFESFESFVIQSGDLIREGHHRCGRRRTADVTTAANCDIRVT